MTVEPWGAGPEKGGNMANLADSTLDPVFWLHHGVVDFMFTFWQAGVMATHARLMLVCWSRRGSTTRKTSTPPAQPVKRVAWLTCERDNVY